MNDMLPFILGPIYIFFTCQIFEHVCGPQHPGVQHQVELLHSQHLHILRLRVDSQDLGQELIVRQFFN
jgi:hypothetical protein